MHQFMNFALIAVIGLGVLAGVYSNPMECALLLGRGLFALLLATALFVPVSGMAQDFFDLAPAYANMGAYLVLWLVVLFALGPILKKAFGEDGKMMDLQGAPIIRGVAGLVAGLLVAMGLSVAMVLAPPVERAYFVADVNSTAGFHNAASRTFSVCTFGSHDDIAFARMQAALAHAEEAVRREVANGDETQAQILIARFETRYRIPKPTMAEAADQAAVVEKLRDLAWTDEDDEMDDDEEDDEYEDDEDEETDESPGHGPDRGDDDW